MPNIAYVTLNHHPPAISGHPYRGFTLMELLTVVVIVSVLASLAIPSLVKMRNSAAVTKCQTNIRQIGVLIQLYANENNGVVVYDVLGDNGAQGTWADGLNAFGTKEKFSVGKRPLGVFSCPSSTTLVTNSSKSDYTKNYYVNPTETSTRRKYKLFEVSTQRVLALADGSGRYFNESTPAITGRHNGKANMYYFDGHMEFLAPSQVPLTSAMLPLYPQ